jgi:hypothetical protein
MRYRSDVKTRKTFKQLLDVQKEISGYWKLKMYAVDNTLKNSL